MINYNAHKTRIEETGFTTINNLFSNDQVAQILQIIDQTDTSRKTFRKSADLFAIRQFFKEMPEIFHLIFNAEFKLLIQHLFGSDYFIVKSIYFDKPEQSNWFVSYHQDLTISLDKKAELDHYDKWTVKQDQFSVQPPIDILKKNIYRPYSP